MSHEYSQFAKQYNCCLRCGELRQALSALREMATIRRAEGCDADEMKLLMLAFYISTSGCAGEPRIEAWIANAAQESAERNKGYWGDALLGQMYLDTVRNDTTPTQIMSVQDSRYLFEMVASGGVKDAETAVQRFADSSR